MKDKCTNCNGVAKIEAKPSRHLTSPNTASFKLAFCSKKCIKAYNQESGKFYAELDRNSSDSQCFIHDHWEKDKIGRNMRVGQCRITGLPVRVEPNQPGNNSGQPIECYEHFKLRL